MLLSRLSIISLFLAASTSAASLRVGPGEAHTTIQSALDAAVPGDVIEVESGHYPENLVIATAPLTLTGPRAGDDARGRVTGVPNPALEAVIAPAAGVAIEIAAGGGAVAIEGFTCMTPAAVGGAVVSVYSLAIDGLVFANNHVEVEAGGDGAALRFNREVVNATLTGNVFMASADSAAAVLLDGGHAYHGLALSNNDVIRSGAVAGHGLHVDGVRNLGSSPLRASVISGNRFKGHGVGLFGGARSLDGVSISGNTFESNGEGMSAGPLNCVITGNIWLGNGTVGLRLTALGETNDPAFGAAGGIIEYNQFENNGLDVRCDDQAPGTLDSLTIRRNRFLSPLAFANGDADVVLDAEFNFWGAADGPGGQASGSGGQLTGAGTYSHEPFYADFALTSLNYGSTAVSGEWVVGQGESITGEELTLAADGALVVEDGGSVEIGLLVMPAGSRIDVRRGAVTTTKLAMDNGAVIDVVDGDFTFDPTGDGSYHTVSGTFTFFNSLGSIRINGNTSFSGATLGLASDIHVLPGVTIIVTGSLVLDGCRVESSGTFSLLVDAGASLKMTRCEVTGAAVSLVGSDVTLKNNRFTTSSVTCFSTVNGAEIYHNVFNGGLGLLNILSGAVVTTEVEGWSNVASAADVINELTLAFRPPGDASRTLDAEGVLYVQPGDAVDVGLDISRLNAKTQGVEVMLGFSTDYLAFDALLPSADWPNNLYEAADETGIVGLFDSAVGLGFSYPDPDGTTEDGEVADIRMTAQTTEGRTRFFFRTKNPLDAPFIDTRLTVSEDGDPSYKAHPFTVNSPTLVVDGTEPEYSDEFSVTQVRGGDEVDLLAENVFTRMGTVAFAFDLRDDLAGIDDADVSAVLTGPSGTMPGTPSGSSLVVVDGVDYTRWTFTFEISSTTPDGVYNVDAIAMDRSGNTGILAAGAIEVARYQIFATVEPQGLITSTLTRDVVFKATGAGGTVLMSWTEPVEFTGGLGTTILERVPDGTTNLSAKMAWNLRVREAVIFDSEGIGEVSFTGARRLRGGDFTGDNIINLSDYNVLRSVFPGIATTADITGDGFVNLSDYNVFRSNWLTMGEPE